MQRHERFVGRGRAGRIGDPAEQRVAVVGRSELGLKACPGIDVVRRPKPADRLGLVLVGIDRARTVDGDCGPVDVLCPAGGCVAAPHSQLEADVRMVGAVVRVELVDRRRDGRRIKYFYGTSWAVRYGLQLRPGDIEHDLAERLRIVVEIGERELRDWIAGIVVEADVAHIDEAALRRLRANIRVLTCHGLSGPHARSSLEPIRMALRARLEAPPGTDCHSTARADRYLGDPGDCCVDLTHESRISVNAHR